ncbi:MAG: hypothetical protein AB8G17_12080 [Gammaproteobacteria bacterium]
MKQKNIIQVLGGLFALAVCGGAMAAPISVQTVAELEQRFVDASGEAQTRLVPADAVVPGDQVIYTVTFTNNGDEPAQQIVITDPVPAQMRYVDGSAFGPGTDITFSIDGGESFAVADQLVVTDAQGRERPARASDFTHIRWGFRHVLAPGERGYARFKAVLD